VNPIELRNAGKTPVRLCDGPVRGHPRRGIGCGASLAGWFDHSARTFWRWTGLLIGLAGWTILVHLIEITLWALFYTWKKGMPDAVGVVLQRRDVPTTGYGDLVLPKSGA
jgi:hypothetical protein